MHTTVLLHESIHALNPKKGEVIIDGTLGAGGHSLLIGEKIGKEGTLFCFDKDGDAIKRARKKLQKLSCTLHFHKGDFATMDEVVEKKGFTAVNGILLDLGISSDQLESSGRGFTFKKDEPLLMTLKDDPKEEDTTAHDVVNVWSEEHLRDIIRGFGEERYAGRIARAIVEAREIEEIKTTKELAKIIEGVVPGLYRKGKIHPATRTFQAIRIATNGELQSLEKALERGYELLEKGGRFVVISFHSLEDRIVKRFFKEKAREGEGEELYKKPLTPTEEEIINNPRSRSAKLRAIRKI